MSGMSKPDAQKSFHREHRREILIMLQDEQKSKSPEIDQRVIRSLN
jgi:hypothetical protein